jgi:anti-anti-sigma factor
MLHVVVEQFGDKHILHLEGQVNAKTAPSLKSEIDSLFEEGHKKVLLECGKVSEFSEDGFQLLSLETKRFNGINGELALSNLNDVVLQKAQNRGLCIYRNEQEALKSMG